VGISPKSGLGRVYQNIVGIAPSAEVVTQLALQVGAGHTFATMGDLFALGAMLSQNTQKSSALSAQSRLSTPAFSSAAGLEVAIRRRSNEVDEPYPRHWLHS
jgi:hypothetical protein